MNSASTRRKLLCSTLARLGLVAFGSSAAVQEACPFDLGWETRNDWSLASPGRG